MAAAMQVAPLAVPAAAGARAPRSLPSPTILGARPPVKKAATTDMDPFSTAAAADSNSNYQDVENPNHTRVEQE